MGWGYGGSFQSLQQGNSASKATGFRLKSHSGIPHSSVGKESACSPEDPGSIPGSGRSLGEGNSNPLQYSCLENSMDRGAWQATVHGVAKSRTRLSERLHFHQMQVYIDIDILCFFNEYDNISPLYYRLFIGKTFSKGQTINRYANHQRK